MTRTALRGTGSVFRRGRVWWIRYSGHGADGAIGEMRESARTRRRSVAQRLLAARLAERGAAQLVTHDSEADERRWEARRASERVYIIRCDLSGMSKIGVTTNVARRFATIQAHSPTQLRIIATLRGGLSLEQELHSKFRAYRRHGEWFALPAEALTELAALGDAERRRAR